MVALRDIPRQRHGLGRASETGDRGGWTLQCQNYAKASMACICKSRVSDPSASRACLRYNWRPPVVAKKLNRDKQQYATERTCPELPRHLWHWTRRQACPTRKRCDSKKLECSVGKCRIGVRTHDAAQCCDVPCHAVQAFYLQPNHVA